MSPARLARFLPAAKGDPQLALRLYVWNGRLCEALYLPLQMAEVAVRNAIHGTLLRRFKATWYADQAFLRMWPVRYQDEVYQVATDQAKLRGKAFAVDHVVAGLTFGFWVHLLTARYDNILWQAGALNQSFPHIAKGTTRGDVHLKVEALRNFRNRVAHHSAIFDKGPKAEYQKLTEIVGLICPDTVWLIQQISDLDRAINDRPRA